jgi:hypothetical protein
MYEGDISNQNIRSGAMNEDYIPSEEPLINMREFWSNNISHNYRMRWPRHQSSTIIGGPQLRVNSNMNNR